MHGAPRLSRRGVCRLRLRRRRRGCRLLGHRVQDEGRHLPDGRVVEYEREVHTLDVGEFVLDAVAKHDAGDTGHARLHERAVVLDVVLARGLGHQVRDGVPDSLGERQAHDVDGRALRHEGRLGAGVALLGHFVRGACRRGAAHCRAVLQALDEVLGEHLPVRVLPAERQQGVVRGRGREVDVLAENVDVGIQHQRGPLRPLVAALLEEGERLAGLSERVLQLAVRDVGPREHEEREAQEERVLIPPRNRHRVLCDGQRLRPTSSLVEGAGRAVHPAGALHEHEDADLGDQDEHAHLALGLPQLPPDAARALRRRQGQRVLLALDVYPRDEVQRMCLAVHLAHLPQELLGLRRRRQGLVRLVLHEVDRRDVHQRGRLAPRLARLLVQGLALVGELERLVVLLLREGARRERVEHEGLVLVVPKLAYEFLRCISGLRCFGELLSPDLQLGMHVQHFHLAALVPEALVRQRRVPGAGQRLLRVVLPHGHGEHRTEQRCLPGFVVLRLEELQPVLGDLVSLVHVALADVGLDDDVPHLRLALRVSDLLVDLQGLLGVGNHGLDVTVQKVPLSHALQFERLQLLVANLLEEGPRFLCGLHASRDGLALDARDRQRVERRRLPLLVPGLPEEGQGLVHRLERLLGAGPDALVLRQEGVRLFEQRGCLHLLVPKLLEDGARLHRGLHGDLPVFGAAPIAVDLGN
mmetsp:Transcript_27581/g.78023  ORF Transcript_27581/g.78023 Transcript_27581/m.78023 type:complete len:698 (-) Transcript_27581:412-2505(-)